MPPRSQSSAVSIRCTQQTERQKIKTNQKTPTRPTTKSHPFPHSIQPTNTLQQNRCTSEKTCKVIWFNFFFILRQNSSPKDTNSHLVWTLDLTTVPAFALSALVCLLFSLCFSHRIFLSLLNPLKTNKNC